MKTDTQIELRTERLVLRPAQTSDAEMIFNYRSDAETNKYQGWIPESIHDVHVFLAKIAPEIDTADTWYQFVLVKMDDSKIIGDLGIHFIDDRQAEVGCTVAKAYQTKGYAKEALKSVMDYLFRKLNKHRIIASVDPQNKGSIRLVESLGFRKEAHFKESLFLNGEWVDDLVYALLQRELIHPRGECTRQ